MTDFKRYTVILCFSDNGEGHPGMFMESVNATSPDAAKQAVRLQAIDSDWDSVDLADTIVLAGMHDALPLDEPEPEPPRVECPNCGRGPERARHVEDIAVWRAVRTQRPDGTLVCEGGHHSGEGYDEGSNGRLECQGCGQEYPLPDGLTIDFD